MSGKLITSIILFILSGYNHLLATPDSLRVVSTNGNRFIEHKVEPKETLSGLSRRYKVSVQELQSANPGLRVLQIGQLVKVPLTGTEGVKKSDVTGEKKKADDPLKSVIPANSKISSRHTVLKGETLYSISQRHGLTVDELKAMNGLKSNDLKVGQQVVIRKAEVANSAVSDSGGSFGVNESAGFAKSNPPKSDVRVPVAGESKGNEVSAPTGQVSKVSDDIKSTVTDTASGVLPSAYDAPGASRTSKVEKDPKTGVVIEKITEVGVASWLESAELNQNKFYCLHRTAPVGTIIKIINRMNNNSVFVKVVGVLPDTGDNANVIVKMTQAAAQRIGALDARFTAELNYGVSR